MDIIGLEVIPQRRAAAVGIAPPGKVQLTYGDTLRISTSLKYRGQARSATLYGSIGNKGFAGFDEIISADTPLSLPQSPLDFSPVSGAVDIPITADIASDKTYSIYVKLKEFESEAGRPGVDNVIDIVGIAPTFTLLEENVYPYAYVYDGREEVYTFTFQTDPFTPVNWVSGRLASHVESEVKKAGGRIMEMRVYVDQTPLLWNNWRIEAYVQPPAGTAGLGAPLGIVWFAVAIIAALAIILIIVITWSIKSIVSTFTHRAISEEIKKSWSRETLISAIGDFEEKLDRTPTPPEDLQQKDTQELIDYCDELANVVAPGGGAGSMALLIIGGAVLGLGAVGITAYALSRPKETGKTARR